MVKGLIKSKHSVLALWPSFIILAQCLDHRKYVINIWGKLNKWPSGPWFSLFFLCISRSSRWSRLLPCIKAFHTPVVPKHSVSPSAIAHNLCIFKYRTFLNYILKGSYVLTFLANCHRQLRVEMVSGLHRILPCFLSWIGAPCDLWLCLLAVSEARYGLTVPGFLAEAIASRFVLNWKSLRSLQETPCYSRCNGNIMVGKGKEVMEMIKQEQMPSPGTDEGSRRRVPRCPEVGRCVVTEFWPGVVWERPGWTNPGEVNVWACGDYP